MRFVQVLDRKNATGPLDGVVGSIAVLTDKEYASLDTADAGTIYTEEALTVGASFTVGDPLGFSAAFAGGAAATSLSMVGSNDGGVFAGLTATDAFVEVDAVTGQTVAPLSVHTAASGAVFSVGPTGAITKLNNVVVPLANAYTVTNPTTDRALNVTADTLAQGLAVLGTLIADLKTLGVLQ